MTWKPWSSARGKNEVALEISERRFFWELYLRVVVPLLEASLHQTNTITVSLANIIMDVKLLLQAVSAST